MSCFIVSPVSPHPRTLLFWFPPFIPLLIHSFIFSSSSLNRKDDFQARCRCYALARAARAARRHETRPCPPLCYPFASWPAPLSSCPPHCRPAWSKRKADLNEGGPAGRTFRAWTTWLVQITDRAPVSNLTPEQSRPLHGGDGTVWWQKAQTSEPTGWPPTLAGHLFSHCGP